MDSYKAKTIVAKLILPEPPNLQVGDVVLMKPNGNKGMYVKDFSKNERPL